MRYLTISGVAGIACLFAATSVAEAQMGPGMGGGGPMGGGGGMGPTQPSGEQKKEGVAEAAPKTALLPTTPALPPQKSRRKRFKLIELDGYYRMRTEWLKNFNLGYIDDPTLGGAPFSRALSCNSTVLNHPCDDTLSSTNMRLRLEPTINIDEGTSVHVQADALDNLVLGSTPTNENLSGIYTTTNRPPVGAFGNTQAPPQAGINGTNDSFVVKRAWGEVAIPLGVLKFGRMPNQWGMGIYANAGGADPINGTYNYDADYGDSVDRVSFSAQIPGTALRIMLAADWDLRRLVSSQTSANTGNTERPYDLDNPSDTNGWVGVISKMEPPQEFRDAVDRGENMLDYGVYFEYKTQDWDFNPTGFTLGSSPNVLAETNYVQRGLKTYTPDLWAKLGIGSLLFEGELVGQFGSVNYLSDLGITGTENIRKIGGAGRMTWHGVEGKLRIGLESGFATGDQWDNTPQGNTNIAYANTLGDPSICNTTHTCTLTQFMFNPAYNVDMILWRRLVGAVTNAAYFKPFLQYDITKSIMFKVANITSFALNPVATPGNGSMYGTEFDSDIGYNGSHIYAGISFGVLFPLAAMSHPEADTTQGGPGFTYGTDALGNPNYDASGAGPGTAYTIQTRLVLTF